ncbi:hypothetical protein ACFRAR_22315 [Kitasatospora sp. NPDC056651]|uniref:hypothetical protein n=1 Tax=Kitasatospora sp. NPDC056651 TaxID=3345892 RepID=UPI0036C2B65B
MPKRRKRPSEDDESPPRNAAGNDESDEATEPEDTGRRTENRRLFIECLRLLTALTKAFGSD